MDTNTQRFDALPARTRKAARTRVGLLDAMLNALQRTPFDGITTQELCDAVGITQPTFFKYYPLKTDLLVGFVHVWSIELQHRMAALDTGHERLETLFGVTAEHMVEHPRIMREIIAHQMRMDAPPTLAAPTQAELLLRFPDVDGIELLSPVGIDGLIARALHHAQARAELDTSDEELPVLTSLLVAAFFGIPAVRHEQDAVTALYRQALDRLVPWRAAP